MGISAKYKELKWFVQKAKEIGISDIGPNGGGYIQLAHKCGLDTFTKGQALTALRGKFGTAPELYLWIEKAQATKAKKKAKKSIATQIKSIPKNWSGKDFYMSPQWKKLRWDCLKTHAWECASCGATREDGVKLHVDHIKPRSKRPDLELVLDNLQVLCEPCNIGKSNRDDTDLRIIAPTEFDIKAVAHLRSIQ